MPPKDTISIQNRFWSHVTRTESCWEWTGLRTAQGYGRFSSQSIYRAAHRVSYELTYGPIPDGLDVCHHCDNPPCVRPDHLFLGSVSDNMRDAVQKGRKGGKPAPWEYGERHHNAKLTPEQVREIRSLAATGMTHVALARRYGIGDMQVSRIVHRKRWKHLE